MSTDRIKIGFDLSQIDRLASVVCLATTCRHNTLNRSHGVSGYGCDYKHVCLSETGRCRAYEVEASKTGEGTA